jgi:hypothetical protein
MEYINLILIIFIPILIGLSIWLLYLSKVQYRLEHRIRQMQMRRKFKMALDLQERDEIRKNLIRLALENLKSLDHEKKITALASIRQLDQDASYKENKFIYAQLIRHLCNEDDERIKYFVVDELCRLNSQIKSGFK